MSPAQPVPHLRGWDLIKSIVHSDSYCVHRHEKLNHQLMAVCLKQDLHITYLGCIDTQHLSKLLPTKGGDHADAYQQSHPSPACTEQVCYTLS